MKSLVPAVVVTVLWVSAFVSADARPGEPFVGFDDTALPSLIAEMAPASLFGELFVGAGEAEVNDLQALTTCTTHLALLVYETHEGWRALQRFSPACLEMFPLNTWPFLWVLYPDDYVLEGNWETGFVGEAPPFVFFGHIEIGPYEDGVDIPITGEISLPGPLHYLWSGTVTDVNKLIQEAE